MTFRLKGLLLLSSSLLLAIPAVATPPGFNEPGMGRAGMPQTEATPRSAQDWWPNVVDLSRLRQNEYNPDPNGADFDYSEEFANHGQCVSAVAPLDPSRDPPVPVR